MPQYDPTTEREIEAKDVRGLMTPVMQRCLLKVLDGKHAGIVGSRRFRMETFRALEERGLVERDQTPGLNSFGRISNSSLTVRGRRYALAVRQLQGEGKL